jgi:hypothetical protein
MLGARELNDSFIFARRPSREVQSRRAGTVDSMRGWVDSVLRRRRTEERRDFKVGMRQNLMILARLGDLRTQFDLGVLPPLVLRCSSGLSRAPLSEILRETKP